MLIHVNLTHEDLRFAVIGSIDQVMTWVAEEFSDELSNIALYNYVSDSQFPAWGMSFVRSCVSFIHR